MQFIDTYIKGSAMEHTNQGTVTELGFNKNLHTCSKFIRDHKI